MVQHLDIQRVEYCNSLVPASKHLVIAIANSGIATRHQWCLVLEFKLDSQILRWYVYWTSYIHGFLLGCLTRQTQQFSYVSYQYFHPEQSGPNGYESQRSTIDG